MQTIGLLDVLNLLVECKKADVLYPSAMGITIRWEWTFWNNIPIE